MGILDYEDDGCDHDDYEVDILTGRATCACGYRWYMTAEAMKRHEEHMAQHDKIHEELNALDLHHRHQGRSPMTLKDEIQRALEAFVLDGVVARDLLFRASIRIAELEKENDGLINAYDAITDSLAAVKGRAP